MKLGAFSLSLDVEDIAVSTAFYEKLGFEVVAGNADDGWLILRNDSCTLGLFKGHIGHNTLTFNPGWDAQGQTVGAFEDVRSVQKKIEDSGLRIQTKTDPVGTGPAYIILHDPDGNPILIDQHVDQPQNEPG